MKQYTILVTEQFVRDRRVVLHAQSKSDLDLRIAEMTKVGGLMLMNLK